MHKVFQIMFFICLGVIEFLATTTQHIEIVSSIWDKANHFSAFFVLYILLSLAYRNLSLSYKVILLFLYAVQIEIVQIFIEGRFFSMLDIVADCIGVFFGFLIYKYFLLKIRFLVKQSST